MDMIVTFYDILGQYCGHVGHMSWTYLGHDVHILGPYCGHSRIMFGTCCGHVRPMLQICSGHVVEKLWHVVDMLCSCWGQAWNMLQTC